MKRSINSLRVLFRSGIFLMSIALVMLIAKNANAQVPLASSGYLVSETLNLSPSRYMTGSPRTYWEVDRGSNPDIVFRFTKPIVNQPGPDVAYIMQRPGLIWGGSSRVIINGQTIEQSAVTPTGTNSRYPFAGASSYYALIDFSDYGVPLGATVDSAQVLASLQSSSTNYGRWARRQLATSLKYGNYSDTRVKGFVEIITLDKGNPSAVNVNATCVAPGTTQTINVVPPSSYGPDGPGEIRIASQPVNGAATVNSTTAIDYTPTAFGALPDTFSYEVCDADGDCASAQLTISCVHPDSAPQANDDAFMVDGHLAQTLNYDVLANDNLLQHPLTQFRITSGNPTVQGGQVSIVNNQLVYTPPIGFEGNDLVVYEICNQFGCDTATVTFTVKGQDDAPEAADDVFEVVNGQSLNLSVLDNDSFGVNGRGSFRIVSGPTEGSATINRDFIVFAAASTVSQDPNNQYLGYADQQIVYEICDNDAGVAECAQATATVKILPELQIEFVSAKSEDIFFNLTATPYDDDENLNGEKRSNDNQLEVSVRITNNAFTEATSELEFCFYLLESPAGVECANLIPTLNGGAATSDVVNVPAIGSSSEMAYTLNFTEAQRTILRDAYNADLTAQADLLKAFGLFVRDKNRYTTIATTDSLEVFGYELPNNEFLLEQVATTPIVTPTPTGLLDSSIVEETTSYRKTATTPGGEGTAGGITHEMMGEASMRLVPIDPASPQDGGVFLNSQNDVVLSVNGVSNTVSIDGNVEFNPSQENCFSNTAATISENGAVVATRSADCADALTVGDVTRHFEYSSSTSAGTASCTLSTVGSMLGSAQFNVELGVMTDVVVDARFGLRYADLSNANGPFNLVNAQFYQYLRENFRGLTPRQLRVREQYVTPYVQVVEGANTAIMQIDASVSGKVTANETISNVQDLLYARVVGEITLPQAKLKANLQGGMIPEGRDENDNNVIDGLERKELRGYGVSYIEATCSAAQSSDIVLEVKDLWAQKMTKTLLSWNAGETSVQRELGLFKIWPYANDVQNANNTLLTRAAVLTDLSQPVQLEQQCRAGVTNLSLGQVASQISDYSVNHLAGNAVDGINRYASGKTSFTGRAVNPWWQVDLGHEQDLSRVEFTLQRTGFDEVVVLVSNNPFGDETLAQLLERSDVTSFQVNSPVAYKKHAIEMGCLNGRYVRLQVASAGNHYLVIPEFTILGNDRANFSVEEIAVVDDSLGDVSAAQCVAEVANIALNKQAEQSSNYSSWVAANAVDGVDRYSAASTAMTAAENQPWWQVDLGSVHDISAIQLHATYYNALKELNVYVSDAPFGNQTMAEVLARNDVQKFQLTAFENRQELLIDTGCIQGRYVRVQGVAVSTTAYLRLDEVVILGGAVTQSEQFFNAGQCVPGGAADLAKQGITRQSTTSSAAYVSSNAVDGFDHYGSRMGSRTKSEVNPFWEINLGQVQDISMIQFKSFRAMGAFHVFVANQPLADATMAQLLGRSDVTAYSFDSYAAYQAFQLATGCLQGQYVRIQMASSGVLYLDEISIFGRDNSASNDSQMLITGSGVDDQCVVGAKDLSANQQATMSSVYGSYVPGNALDEFFISLQQAMSYSEMNPWWQVDLGAVRDVSMVEISSVHNQGAFAVIISEQPLADNIDIYHASSLDNVQVFFGDYNMYQDYMLETGCVKGRYVRVMLTDQVNQYLRLNEVKVLGSYGAAQ